MIELSSKRTVSPRTAGRSNERFDFGGVAAGSGFEFVRVRTSWRGMVRIRTIKFVCEAPHGGAWFAFRRWSRFRRGSRRVLVRVQTEFKPSSNDRFGLEGFAAGFWFEFKPSSNDRFGFWRGSRRGSGSSSNRAQTTDSVLEGFAAGFWFEFKPSSNDRFGFGRIAAGFWFEFKPAFFLFVGRLSCVPARP